MSGAVAAHAAYNGSGTQGLAVTNKIDADDGDVMSVFWNKNDTTRQLVYGSAYNEVPSSGAQTLNYGGSRLFNVNNDIDCLGDVILEIGVQKDGTNTVAVDYTAPAAGTAASLGASAQTFTLLDNAATSVTEPGMLGTQQGFFDQMILEVQHELNGQATTLLSEPVSNQTTSVVGVSNAVNLPTIQNIIDRIEVQVGTQIWQTLEHEDLEVCNATELTSGAYSEINRQCTLPSSQTLPQNQNSQSPLEQRAYIRVPCFTKTVQPTLCKYTEQTEDGYPMAAAPHQSVKFKVDFASDGAAISTDHTDPGFSSANIGGIMIDNTNDGANNSFNTTANHYFNQAGRGGVLNYQFGYPGNVGASPGQGQDPTVMQVMWDAEWAGAVGTATFASNPANVTANSDPLDGYGVGVIDYAATLSIFYQTPGPTRQNFSVGNLVIRLRPQSPQTFAENCYQQYINGPTQTQNGVAVGQPYSQQFLGAMPVWAGADTVRSAISDFYFADQTGVSPVPQWVHSLNSDGNGGRYSTTESGPSPWGFVQSPYLAADLAVNNFTGFGDITAQVRGDLLSFETGDYFNNRSNPKRWYGIVQSMTCQSWYEAYRDTPDGYHADAGQLLKKFNPDAYSADDPGPLASCQTIIDSINANTMLNNVGPTATPAIESAWAMLRKQWKGESNVYGLGWGPYSVQPPFAPRIWSIFDAQPGLLRGGTTVAPAAFLPATPANNNVINSNSLDVRWGVDPSSAGPQNNGSTNAVLNTDILQGLPLTIGALYDAAQSTYAGPIITACRMFAKQQIMCNEEREEIKSMPHGLPKRLKMTQNAFATPILSGPKPTYTMDLDHFSLYASYLVIAIETHDLFSAELKLNSSSFSGALPGPLLYSASSESLGIYGNKNIFATSISPNTGTITDQSDYHYYVFPLAATAYSGSAVPLNRFDSIRLMLTFAHDYTSSAVQKISVTCIGETTALFKDGAASLAMY